MSAELSEVLKRLSVLEAKIDALSGADVNVEGSGDLITLLEASLMVDLSEKTLRRWITQGTLTGYRVGPRALRVSRDEVSRIASPIPSGGAA